MIMWWDPIFIYRRRLSTFESTAIATGTLVEFQLDPGEAAILYGRCPTYDEVAVVHWDGTSWTEINRWVTRWESNDIRFVFELPEQIPAYEQYSNIFLYYSRRPRPDWADQGFEQRYPIIVAAQEDTASGYCINYRLTGPSAQYVYDAGSENADSFQIWWWNTATTAWEEIDRHLSKWSSAEISVWFALQEAILEGEESVEYAIYFDNSSPPTALHDAQEIFTLLEDYSTTTVTDWRDALGDVDDDPWALVYLDGYIYVGFAKRAAPVPDPRVVKIDVATMTTVATWTVSAPPYRVYSLTTDGTYIYAAAGSFTSYVYKIDPSTMLDVDSWSGPGYIADIDSDGTWLWASFTGSVRIERINPATMATVATGGVGVFSCPGIKALGDYLYGAAFTSPTKVYKFNKMSMALVDSWTDPSSGFSGRSITTDDTDIYVGTASPGSTYMTGEVIRLDTSLNFLGRWTGPTQEGGSWSLTHLAPYIYVGLDNGLFQFYPGQIFQIDPSDMSGALFWSAGSGHYNVHAVEAGATNIYCTVETEPARVYKIEPPSLESWTGRDRLSMVETPAVYEGDATRIQSQVGDPQLLSFERALWSTRTDLAIDIRVRAAAWAHTYGGLRFSFRNATTTAGFPIGLEDLPTNGPYIIGQHDDGPRLIQEADDADSQAVHLVAGCDLVEGEVTIEIDGTRIKQERRIINCPSSATHLVFTLKTSGQHAFYWDELIVRPWMTHEPKVSLGEVETVLSHRPQGHLQDFFSSPEFGDAFEDGALDTTLWTRNVRNMGDPNNIIEDGGSALLKLTPPGRYYWIRSVDDVFPAGLTLTMRTRARISEWDSAPTGKSGFLLCGLIGQSFGLNPRPGFWVWQNRDGKISLGYMDSGGNSRYWGSGGWQNAPYWWNATRGNWIIATIRLRSNNTAQIAFEDTDAGIVQTTFWTADYFADTYNFAFGCIPGACTPSNEMEVDWALFFDDQLDTTIPTTLCFHKEETQETVAEEEYQEDILGEIAPYHARTFLGVRLGGELWSGYVNQASFIVGQETIEFDGGSAVPAQIDTPSIIVKSSPTAEDTKGVIKWSGFVWAPPGAGTIELYNNVVEWADDDYMYMQDFVPVFSFPYEIPFSASEMRAPVPIMGPDRMGFTDEPLKFIGVESYGRRGKALRQFTWSFIGGTITSAASNMPGTVDAPVEATWDAPGEYSFKLTLVDEDGVSYTGFRSVLIYDRAGRNAPYELFELSGLGGSYEQGGFECAVDLYSAPTLANFPDLALVLVLIEDYFGGKKVALGDQLGAENILFSGYITKGSQTKDADRELVSFDLTTVDALLDRLNVWPHDFVNVSSAPTDWGEYEDLGLDDMVFHFLQDHSTIMETHDVRCSITTRLDAMTSSEQPMMRVINEEVLSSRLAKCVSSRQGVIYIDQDRQYEEPAVRDAHPTEMVIDSALWRETLDLGEERMIEGISQLLLIAFTRELVPVEALSPPFNPAAPAERHWGFFEEFREKLLVASVEEAYRLVGQARAVLNARYPLINIETVPWRALDPARQDYLQLDVASAETLRQHDWSAETLICRSMEWDVGRQTIEAEPIMASTPGGNIAWGPETAEDATLKVVSIFTLENDTAAPKAWVTTAIDAESVMWTEFSAGIDLADSPSGNLGLYDLAWDPFQKNSLLYMACENVIYRWGPIAIGTAEGEWEPVLTLSEFQTLIGDTPSWFIPARIVTSERDQGSAAVYVFYPHPDDSSYYQGRILRTQDWGYDWEASDPLAYSGDSRQYQAPAAYRASMFDLCAGRHKDGILLATAVLRDGANWRSCLFKSTGFSLTFSLLASRAVDANNLMLSAVHAPYEDNLGVQTIYWGYGQQLASYPSGSILRKSLDGGGSWTDVDRDTVIPWTSKNHRIINTLEVDKDTVIVFGADVAGGGAANVYWRSLDKGLTWTAVKPSASGELHFVTLWPADSQQILAGGNHFLFLSVNGGTNWTNKIGDLVATDHPVRGLAYWGMV
jgi:hypothetical protein